MCRVLMGLLAATLCFSIDAQQNKKTGAEATDRSVRTV